MAADEPPAAPVADPQPPRPVEHYRAHPYLGAARSAVADTPGMEPINGADASAGATRI